MAEGQHFEQDTEYEGSTMFIPGNPNSWSTNVEFISRVMSDAVVSTMKQDKSMMARFLVAYTEAMLGTVHTGNNWSLEDTVDFVSMSSNMTPCEFFYSFMSAARFMELGFDQKAAVDLIIEYSKAYMFLGNDLAKDVGMRLALRLLSTDSGMMDLISVSSLLKVASEDLRITFMQKIKTDIKLGSRDYRCIDDDLKERSRNVRSSIMALGAVVNPDSA
jgi:hypothetical protein